MRKRRNLTTTLIGIILLWSLLTLFILLVSPENFWALPLFFILIFTAALFTVSLITNRLIGLLTAILLTAILLLRFLGFRF